MRFGDVSIPGTADPASSANGFFYYDTDLNKFQFRQNGAWAELGGGGESLWQKTSTIISPLTTGDSLSITDMPSGSRVAFSTDNLSGTVKTAEFADSLYGRAGRFADSLSGVYVNMVDGVNAMYLSGGPITQTPISTPGTPMSGDICLYFKSDEKLYKMGGDGVEKGISLWQRTGTELSTATANDSVYLTDGVDNVYFVSGGTAASFNDGVHYAYILESGGTAAARFEDNPRSEVILCNDSTQRALYAKGPTAGYFTDTTRTLSICDSSKAIDSTDGSYSFQAVDTMTARAGYFSYSSTVAAWLAHANRAGYFENTSNSINRHVIIADYENFDCTLRASYNADSRLAVLCNASAAGYFTDGTNSVYLGYGTDALSASNTSSVSASIVAGTVAGSFSDGTRTVQMANGTYAVEATSGSIKGAFTSSDATAGATADVAVAKVGGGTRTLSFKDGLYTGYTDS